MYRRPWRLETDPDKPDYIITTERMNCGENRQLVLIDEVKRSRICPDVCLPAAAGGAAFCDGCSTLKSARRLGRRGNNICRNRSRKLRDQFVLCAQFEMKG
jgi:hypothetical protein